ncbi:MAG: AAA family ATPase [Chloroflexi bacterium]|nr:AAA family ATPase [Chloroflexota bacterium]
MNTPATIVTTCESPKAATASREATIADPPRAARASLPPAVQALLMPESYRHPATDLRLIETHISWVVLAGPYAYKMKKPVNFGFLDFSTVEQRDAACREEVRLNRRLCTGVYYDVVHVVQHDGSYSVGGPGRLVEPLVWMRRLPDEGMLPRLLRRDAVETRLVRRMARRLAQFHEVVPTGPGVDEYGTRAVVRENWDENFTQTAPFVGRTLSSAGYDGIRAYVHRFIEREQDLFRRRVATGRIREGHGDLHAGSVCVEGRRLHFFDCIEFNRRFRCADVVAEVAFLAMDLDHYGKADLAQAFVDEYVRQSRDPDLYRLLDFYKCYRAYVRGKVLGFRLDEPDLPAAASAAVAERAEAYFDLAWSYADPPVRPVLVVAMGLPASGKTTVARALAGRLGLVHLSSDVVRKQLAGVPATEHRQDTFGQGLYRAAMTKRTYATLRRRAARWLPAGRSVVLDATFGSAAERAAVRRLAERLRATLLVLHCQAGESLLLERLRARATSGETPSDARVERWPALRGAFTEPAELERRAVVVPLDTSRPFRETVHHALTTLRRYAHQSAA